MKLDPRWIVVDLTDQAPTTGNDLTIHSANTTPIERRLRRCLNPRRNNTPELAFDKDGADAFSRYVASLDYTNPSDGQHHTHGLHAAHHFVTHPHFGALSVAVWLHPTPPPPPPILNSWILDLDDLVTVTAGDDVTIIGDGRKVGESRPIQDLWRFIDPTDAATLVRRYAEALANPPGTWMSIEWTLCKPGSEPIHFFSGGRIADTGNGKRIITGTSTMLERRTTVHPNIIGAIGDFAGITLALVNWAIPAAITSIGAEAPLSNAALATLVKTDTLPSGAEHTVTIDGIGFTARSVPLTATNTDAALVMLRRAAP